MFASLIVSRVQRAAIAAPVENSSRPIAPVTPMSWLPARQIAAWRRASSTQASGSAP